MRSPRIGGYGIVSARGIPTGFAFELKQEKIFDAATLKLTRGREPGDATTNNHHLVRFCFVRRRKAPIAKAMPGDGRGANNPAGEAPARGATAQCRCREAARKKLAP